MSFQHVETGPKVITVLHFLKPEDDGVTTLRGWTERIRVSFCEGHCVVVYEIRQQSATATSFSCDVALFVEKKLLHFFYLEKFCA